MPLKKRRGSGGFYKKEGIENSQEEQYIIIGHNKKTNKTGVIPTNEAAIISFHLTV